MTLGVEYLLKAVFLDPPWTASMPKKPAKRVPRPKKLAHLIIQGRICGCFVYSNSTGQSSCSRKATANLFWECSSRCNKTKDLGFTVSQTEDQSSRVCSPCNLLRLKAPELDFFIKASFQESEHDDDSFQFKKKTECPHHLLVLRQGNAMA